MLFANGVFLRRWRAGGPRKELLTNLLDASQTLHERPAFLELRAFFTGELRLGDIEARFGINAAASRRPSLLREIAPSNLGYDQASRCHWPSQSFKLAHEFHSECVLVWLLHGFGDRLDPTSHHLWLRNPQTLYGLERASLAPGRSDDVQKGWQ